MSSQFRIPPQPGQESVWDYPRPPKLEPTNKLIEVIFNGVAIARTNQAFRVLETSHPPVYYLPPCDVQMQYLQLEPDHSYCEWKGIASYYSLSVNGKIAKKCAWFYPDPTPKFAPIKHYIAFYAQPMDACYVNGELVKPQPGNFYGGWITADIAGRFKGEAGVFA